MVIPLLIFIFSLLLFVPLSGACPEGSIPSITNSSICYVPFPQKTAFLSAEEICMQNGGHLASIHSAFENEYIKEQAKSVFTDIDNFWIGFSDLKSPGIWSWMDKSAVDFKDWGKAQPTNLSGADCAAMNLQGGSWVSDQCDSLKSFFCEKQIDSTPTTSCPDSWHFNGETGFCYGVFNMSLTWGKAEDWCFANGGGHLVSIHTLAENVYVTNLIHFDPNDHDCDEKQWVYLGLYTTTNQADWRWTDNSPFDYSAWAPGRPGYPNLLAYCGVLWNGPPCNAPIETWADDYCNNLQQQYFICKKLPS